MKPRNEWERVEIQVRETLLGPTWFWEHDGFTFSAGTLRDLVRWQHEIIDRYYTKVPVGVLT